MTTPITDHDPGDESNHQEPPEFPGYREIVGLHGIESVVPSSGSWMQEQRRIIVDDHDNTPTRHPYTYPDKQPQIHKEGAD